MCARIDVHLLLLHLHFLYITSQVYPLLFFALGSLGRKTIVYKFNIDVENKTVTNEEFINPKCKRSKNVFLILFFSAF